MAKQRTNSKKLSEKSEREGKSMIIIFNKRKRNGVILQEVQSRKDI